MYSNVYWGVLIICTVAFTSTAAFIDYRTKKIPNKLTLPMFAAGWIFQLFNPQGPLTGLLDGFSGFLLGFGMFFVLWIIGSGGGGDAKMVGALSVWLGFWMTLGLIIVSTILVIVGTGAILAYGMATKGVYKTKRELLPGQPDGKKKKGPLELLQFNNNRKGMTYGLSVAIATVVIVSSWPFVVRVWEIKQEKAAARKAAEAQKLENDQSEQEQDADEGWTPPNKDASEKKTSEKPSTTDKLEVKKSEPKNEKQAETDLNTETKSETKSEKSP